MDTTTVSKFSREFLNLAEKEKRVINVSFELPKSFVLVKEKENILVYISQLSPITLEKRTKSFRYIDKNL